MTQFVDPTLPEWVRGDAQRLRQVLCNLVGNALKFSHQGKISVIAGPVLGEPDWLRIVVSDTGIGVSQEKLESIFGSFAQSDSSTTRQFGGTGLGLSISRQLVELMGGRIWVESKLGQGSEFILRIPLVVLGPNEATGLPRRPIRPPQASIQAHVLIVEDNPVNQMVAVGMIHRLGGTTQVATNGQEALDWTRRERFSLILMDWHMPVMDGLDATRAIRLEEGTSARTPILALTANAYESESQLCIQAGMDAVLTKPVEWEDLVGAVTKWAVDPGAAAPHKL